jgi:hypothetical protein
MYESLRSYIGKNEGQIRFLPVEEEDVVTAEADLDCILPSKLKSFYSFVGYGWISSEERRDLWNLIIHPLDIVDLVKGVSEFLPSDEFLDGDLPIFDCGAGKFLVTRPNSSNPECVYRDDDCDQIIAADVEELIYRLVEDPTFYE